MRRSWCVQRFGESGMIPLALFSLARLLLRQGGQLQFLLGQSKIRKLMQIIAETSIRRMLRNK